MPWHLSKSDPRKVYDSLHQPVCVCHKEEQAALIVKAVNGLPEGTLETFTKLHAHPSVLPSDAATIPRPSLESLKEKADHPANDSSFAVTRRR